MAGDGVTGGEVKAFSFCICWRLWQQLVILGSETFSISKSVSGTEEVALGSSDHCVISKAISH